MTLIPACPLAQPRNGSASLSGLEHAHCGNTRRGRLECADHEIARDGADHRVEGSVRDQAQANLLMKSLGCGPPCMATLGAMPTQSTHDGPRRTHGQSTTYTRSRAISRLS